MSRRTQVSLFASRTPWWALAGIALAMEAFALVSQHVWGLEPCNECIYIRFGVAGLLLAGLGGALAPRLLLVRLLFGALSVLSLGYALARAYVLVDLERKVTAGAAASCGRFKGLPGGLPLQEWWPAVFEPRGMCGQITGTFLGQSFAVWTLIGLAALALALLALVVQDWRRP